jgi:hypothetical protein
MSEWEFLGEEHAETVRAVLERAPSGRKWRLFAVACCYRVRSQFSAYDWPLIELAEQLADGCGSVREAIRSLCYCSDSDMWSIDRYAACDALWVVEWDSWIYHDGERDLSAVPTTRADEYNSSSAIWCAERCGCLAADVPPEGIEILPDDPLKVAEHGAQFHVFSDIFGNPFRPVALAPAWRTDTAVALARQMYDSRNFSAMPILADALQDAGCDNDAILNHCRDANQPHVRGCWVCDLVLGL